jgi:NADH-quinone oxidoreductase subunit A
MFVDFAAVLIFVLISIVFVFGNMLLGSFIRPKSPSIEKSKVYECGEPTIGPSWIRYNSRFYTIALVYLLFDVEVVVLVPAMVVLKQLKTESMGMGLGVLVSLLAFLFLLTLGLAYEWFYGNLDWIGAEEEARLIRPVPQQNPGEAHEGSNGSTQPAEMAGVK